MPDREARRTRELLEYSFFTWFFERLFWRMHQISPIRLFARGRIAHLSSEAFRLDPRAATAARSRRVERYLSSWIALEFLLVASIASGAAIPAGVAGALAVIRIVDILQAVVNLMVFDQLRTPQTLIISSAVRTLVLSMVNYLELIVCFAILYLSLPTQLAGASGWTDALYFSVVTQLTIGYGDVTPTGTAKAVAAVQALFTFAFTVLLLGRIITVLPRLESVMPDTRKE
jgi:hypothetical protein